MIRKVKAIKNIYKGIKRVRVSEREGDFTKIREKINENEREREKER